MAGGTSRFDDWTLDYGVARIHNEVIEPNRVWQFRNASDIGPVDFDFSEKLFTAVPRTPVDASNIQFRQLTEQDENGDENIWQLRGDARYALALGDESFFRLGAKYRTTNKTFDAANRRYSRGSSADRFTLVDAGAAGQAVDVPVREDRVYIIPVSIDADAITAFTQGRLGGPQFVLNEDATLEDEVLDDLEIEENVLAGYGMANLDWGTFSLTGGLRVEQTDLKIGGFQLENGETVIPVSEDSDYVSWLPSIVGRYTPARNIVMRLAYHRSIGRPQYSSLSPGGEVEIEADEAFVALGNPQLRPFVAENLDVSAEYYFGAGSFIAAAAFVKFIKDPIFRSTFAVEDGSFRGVPYDRIEFTQPVNGRDARITGIELAFEQQLTFLPGALSGLGIGANVTVVDSELKIPDGDGGFRTTRFAEQSNLLYGVQLFYQQGPIEASIAYHHTGRALISAGDEEFEDQYNDDLRRLDAKAKFQVNRNASLFFEAQNLTDEPTRQYQGGRRDWIIQEERYGRTLWAGASLSL
jgi:TonB-dependent receptor